MRVPDMMLDSVAYLCVKNANGTVVPAGTGFFLSVKSETREQIRHGYLVTARHCIESAAPYGALYARMNRTENGEAGLVELEPSWTYHDDETNDVAVLHFAPRGFRIVVVERESLATADVIENESIGIGEELMVVGLFTRRHGRTANRPIVRAGIIAAMPDEPLEDHRSGLPYDAYLAEVRSIGGLSGSPVWVVINPARFHQSRLEHRLHFYLLGLIRGHWPKKEEWLSDSSGPEQDSLNTGIAIVTPIQKALDIIDSEESAKERRRVDREETRREGADRGLLQYG
jgi:Trypsin-like peptidase domain